MARYDRLKASFEPTQQNAAGPKLSIVLGMMLMCFAMLLAPAMDVVAKYLGTEGAISPGVVTLGRFLVQMIILFTVLLVLSFALHRRKIWPKNIAINLLRGAMMGVAAFLFFTAVTFMPVADAIAIFFVEPFILTILSAVLLGEKVGWRRCVAVLVGFSGALLIIQPSFQALGAVALLPIATAFIFALYLILTRKYAGEDDPLSMQLAAGLGGALMMTVALLIGGGVIGLDPLLPKWPTSFNIWVLLFLLGLIGTVSHMLIVFAFARAPASTLAPFQYVEIISGTLLGFLIFRDFPDFLKWVGIAIIVGSGIYIFWREAAVAKEQESA